MHIISSEQIAIENVFSAYWIKIRVNEAYEGVICVPSTRSPCWKRCCVEKLFTEKLFKVKEIVVIF